MGKVGAPKGHKKAGGRQKGTPNKVTAEVRAAALKYCLDAIKTLAGIMKNSESEQTRVAAAKELLDRGIGRATQQVEVGGVNGDPEIQVHATNEQDSVIITAAEKLVSRLEQLAS